MIHLRDYQLRAIADLRAAYAAGRRAPCLQMPTGAGKTRTAAAIIAGAVSRGTRCLFVTDRSTLKLQTVATLRDAGIPEPRVIQADQDDGPRDALVTVASAQTLRLERCADLPAPDLVVWDEAHGILARTYEATLWRWPRARLLGLTATPCRGDGRPLDVFDHLVLGPSVTELVERGHLARPRVLPPPEGEVGEREIALDPVDAWRRHAGGRRAAVFCATVDQAQRYAAEFRGAGLTTAVVVADTPNRAELIADFAAERYKILLSVGCLTQGWDDPACSVAILVRRPAHVGLWLQMCGRVLRPHPGKADGLILDLGGAFWLHGPPDAHVEWSLTGRAKAVVIKDSLTQCRACGSAFLAGPRVCPYCAAELPVRPRALPRVAGVELVDGAVAPPQRREHVVAMVATRSGSCRKCFGMIRPGEAIHWAVVAKRAWHRACPVPSL